MITSALTASMLSCRLTMYPVIEYGHPKDRETDLKQVQGGLAVSADGGVPVHARDFGDRPGRPAASVRGWWPGRGRRRSRRTGRYIGSVHC
ncbi:hypothetical protein OG562_40885 [Streptomyces sp. NBC_01275]|uniref:hypothetical protein n=1 Tax=Streptomyces sp. NBC_01275 TaxID=2903807 RepID=UPI0022574522|nr:hypothetical protein [Streptomyces sp. NBC_01275]MCX4767218.1 hypothetical protein [Streptomyces sp. NBC_01275]